MRINRIVSCVTLSIALMGYALGLPASVGAEESGPAAARQQDAGTLAGQIVGVSKKAKTISIKVGNSTEMLRFADTTKGMEFAEKGESAIITVAMEKGEKVAVEVKPKLAKLPAGTTEIQPDEVAALVKGGSPAYTLVDSRPAKRFAEASIPTAISIPVDTLKEQGASILPPDKTQLLIFFCGGPTCGLSPEAAGIAVKAGYTNVKIMIKGLPGWKKAGNQAVAAMDFVKKGNVVIVDLRPAAEAAKGYIPRAVNVPLAEFEDVQDNLPKAKSAPFVFYGSGDTPKKAIKMLAGWGYKSASVVNGGLDGWVKAGGQLATGPMSTEIHYTREMEKGEIGVEEFRKIANGGSAQAVILDVRSDDEVADGSFSGAIIIPLDQLAGKMGSLPKDKEILVHCTTGDRAAMAAEQLRKAGFTVRHLVAEIECEEGKCQING